MTSLEIVKTRLQLDDSDVRWLLDKLQDAVDLIEYWHPGKQSLTAKKKASDTYDWEKDAAEFVTSVYGEAK